MSAPCLFAEANIALVSLNDIAYIDYPELRVDEHESTEMPFRYMVDDDGSPIMPLVGCCMASPHIVKMWRAMEIKSEYARLMRGRVCLN